MSAIWSPDVLVDWASINNHNCEITVVIDPTTKVHRLLHQQECLPTEDNIDEWDVYAIECEDGLAVFIVFKDEASEMMFHECINPVIAEAMKGEPMEVCPDR